MPKRVAAACTADTSIASFTASALYQHANRVKPVTSS